MSDILLDPLPEGRLAIEASAGTGKTYSLSALVARSIAEKGVTPAQLLVVTFTRTAAAELRERTRGAILEAADAFRGRATDHPEWLQQLLSVDDQERMTRQQRLDAAVATFDDATITTIHGFCQVALGQLGLRSGAGLDDNLTTSISDLIDEAVRDTLLPVLAQKPDALDWLANQYLDTIVTAFTKAVRTLLGNRHATVVPDLALQQTLGDPKLTLWCELVLAAADTVTERQAARHELGFDDLVLRLRDAVCDAPDRVAAAATISDRYQLVMVDEFQDTDPVQWEIFHTLFGQRLITVGDPKQAIYRFRGADVHAYLAATAAAPTVHLSTNFRSDSDLIDATNLLVSGMQMGHPRITALPVSAGPTAVSEFLPGSPIEVRWLPVSPATAYGGRRKIPVNSEKVVGPILADLAGVIIELLAGGKVGPGDIAVLVPKGKDAEKVSRVLSSAGIPSVRARTGNVLSTPARAEWDLLLAALERPSDALRARGAAASVFMPYRLEQLDPQAPESAAAVADVQRQLAGWAELMSSTGFLAWYDHVRSEGRLLERMLTTPQGERLLTDLDHIGELIATEVDPAGVSPSTVRRALASLTAEAEDRDASETSDRHMRRIDSDAAAVQISTLHGSKGLEYPVVLIPFSPKRRDSYDPVFNDASGQRTIDIAAARKWDLAGPLSVKTRKWYSEAEGHGDALRLLYVGLTRAEHRTVLWWSPTDEASKSALNQYLFDRAPDGTPLNTAPDATALTIPKVASPSDPAAAFAQLADASGGTIGIVEIPVPASLPVAIPTWKPSAAAAGSSTELGVANTGGRTLAQPSWRRWSFTSVSNTREHEWAEHIEHPVVGGADEPEQGEPEHSVSEPSNTPPTASTIDMPWAHTPGGTEFGTLVHGLFEHVHTNHPDLPAHLRELVAGTYRRNHAALPDDELVRGMEAAITTPLGGIADGRRLADLAPSDRLAELSFDLPFGSTPVIPTAIGDVLLATLPADDPQRPYAQLLADGRFAVNLEGYLQGSIDAVLRIPDAAVGHRYVVVDYKTNRLHARDAANPLAAYHPAHLPQHMAHSDYPLQALLYSVALHRFLSWRLGSQYDPAAHLGGIAYLFVRGMVGPNTPQHGSEVTGVFSWRPPAATIVALHRLFAGDDAR